MTTQTITEIVVGTDGSEHGTAAVRWAARAAHHHGTRLRLVHAYDWNWAGARFGGAAAEFHDSADAFAQQILTVAEREALAAAPGVPVIRDAMPGEPAPALLAHPTARQVVVGNRGRGGFASLVLGSVGQRVAVHARQPVVVVRGRTEPAGGPIVVGADGSDSGTHTLELAFAEAAARGAKVVAIRAYHAPAPPWGTDVPPLVYDPQKLEQDERLALAATLAPWRDKHPEVEVEALVTPGDAARVLVGVSHTAQLVVVGHRGAGSLAGTVLGSVALQLIHHADCPVLIARP